MLSWSGENLVITDGAGVVRFDTSEGLFTATDFVSSVAVGPVVVPTNVTSTSSFSGVYINKTTDFTIASVHPAATTVWGMYQSVRTGAGDLTDIADGLWRTATGTGYGALDAVSAGSDPQANVILSTLVLYTFFVSAGVLKMRERIVMRAAIGSTIRMPESTINFRLWVGLFV